MKINLKDMKKLRIRRKKKSGWKYYGRIALILLAVVIGGELVALTVGFYAVKWHYTDVPGTVDSRSDVYQAQAETIKRQQAHLPISGERQIPEAQLLRNAIFCQVNALKGYAPLNTKRILEAQISGTNTAVLTNMIFAVQLRLENQTNAQATLKQCTTAPANSRPQLVDSAVILSVPEATPNAFAWANTEEWRIVREAFTKDKDTVQRAAADAGVNARMIVAVGLVEQFRLYFTQRELFEKFFKPLKILGNATKMAMGVMSMKESFALDIERHLGERGSPYYLGSAAEHQLDFQTSDPSAERYRRLTDEKNHYYSYLYGGLALAQYEAQWQHAGHDIAQRPEILATLYNIGFAHSKPNPVPQVGGSEITINGTTYTFGSLAHEFYYSGELLNEYPYPLPAK